MIARKLLFLLSTLLPSQFMQAEIPLNKDDFFPAIAMPDSETGKERSILDFRGQKVMLQIFASW